MSRRKRSPSPATRLVDVFELPDRALWALTRKGIRTLGDLETRCVDRRACTRFIWEAMLFTNWKEAQAVSNLVFPRQGVPRAG